MALPPPPLRPRALIHIAITANLLEWYDFGVYGFLAYAMGQVFFPVHTPYAALTASFSVFAVSYLMRPLGSLVLGLIGDRRGAGVALRISTLLMALPTVFIGMLPTYSRVGWYAPLLLVVLRFVQGFAAGGEFPISAYYVAARASVRQRGRLGALVHVGGSCGILLAAFIAFILDAAFGETAINDWAWRLPFLLGAPLMWIVLRIRRAMLVTCDAPDTAVTKPLAPSLETLVAGISLVAALEVGFHTMLVWFPGYVQFTLNYSSSEAHASNTFALLCYTLAILASGFASTFVPYRKILLAALLATTCCIYPLFIVLARFHDFVLLMAVLLSFAVLYGCIGGVLLVTLYDLFQRHGRCLALSIAFTLSAPIFGGTVPLICSYMTGGLHLAYFPALYVNLFCLLSLPAAYRLFKSPVPQPIEPLILLGPPAWHDDAGHAAPRQSHSAPYRAQDYPGTQS